LHFKRKQFHRRISPEQIEHAVHAGVSVFEASLFAFTGNPEVFGVVRLFEQGGIHDALEFGKARTRFRRNAERSFDTLRSLRMTRRQIALGNDNKIRYNLVSRL
jgi:hypothetical protein